MIINMHQLRILSKGLTKQTKSVLQMTYKDPQRRYITSPLVLNKNGNDLLKKALTTASSAPFKTWPVAMVESRGDYREEAHLEALISGPLYSSQKTLPRLPIPTIEETLSSFLPTALPLAESEEEANKLKEACRVFPQQAAQLHERLIDRKNEMHDSSWLQLWWNTEGYLKGNE